MNDRIMEAYNRMLKAYTAWQILFPGSVVQDMSGKMIQVSRKIRNLQVFSYTSPLPTHYDGHCCINKSHTAMLARCPRSEAWDEYVKLRDLYLLSLKPIRIDVGKNQKSSVYPDTCSP